MAYAIMRLNKIKSSTAFTRLYHHNFRIVPPQNADPLKEAKNEELLRLFPANCDYNQGLKQRLKQLPYYTNHSPRKNAVLGLECLMTFSREGEENLNLENWKNDNILWLQNTFGKKNVISAILHMDEEVPHIHAVVIPEKDGRLNCNKVLGDRKQMRQLQTSYANAMEVHQLKRGLKKSTAKHSDIHRFYSSINHILDQELPPVQGKIFHETAEVYRKRVNELYKNLKLQLKSLELIIDRKEIELHVLQEENETALTTLSRKQEELNLLYYSFNRIKNQSHQWESLTKGLEQLEDPLFAQELQEIIEQIIRYQINQEEKEKRQNWYHEHDVDL